MGDGSVAGARQKESGGSEQLFHITDNQTPRLSEVEGGEDEMKSEGKSEREDRRGGVRENTENEVKYD